MRLREGDLPGYSDDQWQARILAPRTMVLIIILYKIFSTSLHSKHIKKWHILNTYSVPSAKLVTCIVLISQMGTLRLRKVRYHARGHNCSVRMALEPPSKAPSSRGHPLPLPSSTPMLTSSHRSSSWKPRCGSHCAAWPKLWQALRTWSRSVWTNYWTLRGWKRSCWRWAAWPTRRRQPGTHTRHSTPC